MIYRVDPATGKASIFFDLNSVLNQNAGNTAGTETGLVNWYDIAFDSEGYFDGRPSMFVSSLDRSDPSKNVVFRIAPDGTFMGAFIQFTGQAPGQFAIRPSALLVPPPEQQQFLRGLFVGDASSTGGDTAIFFNANQFVPGQPLDGLILPTGAQLTPLTFGPQVGLTSANSIYPSPVYSAFTDFGLPAGGGIPATPGLSGVQGLAGNLLINNGAPIIASYTDPNFTTVDEAAAIITPFRQFQDIAYDEYGYFSYGATVTPVAGALPTVAPNPPDYEGSLFVSDLGTGLSVDVTPLDPLPTDNPVHVPVFANGAIGVTQDAAGNLVPVFTQTGPDIGGRIVRIGPDGVIHSFADGFNVDQELDSSGFAHSTLSITFSADGTTLYAADNDGIWQFKSTLSLANSTTGQLVGLGDLRARGVPYEGQDMAVAVVDTGVDALTPPLRGRVANGYNVFTNGAGNDDNAVDTLINGHGTLVAGVINQFVPQSTIVPVNIFTPNLAPPQNTTSDLLYNGMKWLNDNPLVADPVRPNKLDRIVAANYGFGTLTSFDTEGTAFRQYRQVVIALKNQLYNMRQKGIQGIAAAGQFGVPLGSTTATATLGDVNGASMPAILNEAISVTGSYPFPFAAGANTPPTDPGLGVIPRPIGPWTIFDGTTAITNVSDPTLVASDALIFKDKILASSNRTATTDYTAPAIDIPTFRRTIAGAGNDYVVFDSAGTSMSSAIVTGSYAVVASAIDYWTKLAQSGGVTADAYLNMPVGTNVLNFGVHGNVLPLDAYATPDGINAILQWTAVPALDQPNPADTILPPTIRGTTDQYREFSRVDVGNAIAAIEGTEALNFLISNNYIDAIDGNNNGLITAAEIQAFVNTARVSGLNEAGAMAALLGGVDRIPRDQAFPTAVGEFPDQPDVLQRRFNFLDYAADGQLNGSISIDQLRNLAHTLLPAPDSFVVTDRQRSSNMGYLLDPTPARNYASLKALLPNYTFVPPQIVRRFRHYSPARFGVGRGQLPGTVTPFYTLFDNASNNAKNTPTPTPVTPVKPVTQTPVTPQPSNRGQTTPTTGQNTPTTGQTPTTPTSNTQTDPPKQDPNELYRLQLLQMIQNSLNQQKVTAPTLGGTSTSANSSLATPVPIPAGSLPPTSQAQTASGTTSTSDNSSSTTTQDSTQPTITPRQLRAERLQMLHEKIASGEIKPPKEKSGLEQFLSAINPFD